VQGTTGPHSTTHRCIFRYFVARKTLEGECYGRVLHIQVQILGAHGHSRSSRMCSVHDPILFTTSCGLPRVRATMSISFKSTRRVDDRLICGAKGAHRKRNAHEHYNGEGEAETCMSTDLQSQNVLDDLLDGLAIHILSIHSVTDSRHMSTVWHEIKREHARRSRGVQACAM